MGFITHINNLKKINKKRLILSSPSGKSFCVKEFPLTEKKDFVSRCIPQHCPDKMWTTIHMCI